METLVEETNKSKIKKEVERIMKKVLEELQDEKDLQMALIDRLLEVRQLLDGKQQPGS